MYSDCVAKRTKSSDVNVTAHEILQALTGEPAGNTSVQRDPEKKELPAKNPAAVALGRLGGLIARKAAQVRWKQA
jgi:hypothetical protein